MRTLRVLSVCLVLAPALTVAAQTSPGSTRVMGVQPTKFRPSLCGPYASNAKLKTGVERLKQGVEDTTTAKRQKAIAAAGKDITEAVTSGGAEKLGVAWLYLGRVYLYQGDVVGADSAFTRSQQLTAACELEITELRQNTWTWLVRPGADFQEAGQNDSALALYREANVIFRGDPFAYSNMGVIFANTGQTDSAIAYFRQAVAVSTDSAQVADRNRAQFNLGLVLTRAGRHQEAVDVLRQYLQWVPGDNTAQLALATEYRALGMADSASALETAMVGSGEPKSFDSLSTGQLMDLGVGLFNAKKYQEAAKAFLAVVARNPNNRDGLYNLANTFYVLQDGPNLVETAAQLVAIDPLNEDNLRLLAQGYKLSQNQDSLVKIAERLLALPVNFEVTTFAISKNGARLAGAINGRDAQTAAGKPIAPAPLTLLFEFLDETGGVAATEEVGVKALAAGQAQPVELTITKPGISAWRYHLK